MTFTPGQRVTAYPFGQATPATIIENIDHTCAPLTGMWLIRLDNGSTFGMSAKGITA